MYKYRGEGYIVDIIFNLWSNAVKFTSSGAVSVFTTGIDIHKYQYL